MKKTGKLIWILTAACMVFTLLGIAACGGDENKKPKSSIFVISDFESDGELLTMNWFNSFGKIDLSSEHVASGEKSAKMEVHGYAGEGAASFKIYTDSKYCQKADYSMATSFELDVYNDSDRDLDLAFQFKSASFTKGGVSETQVFTLKKKQANKVKYSFDRAFLNRFIDIGQISEFIFTFPVRSVGEKPFELYFDRFAAKLSDVPLADAKFDAFNSYVIAGQSFTVPTVADTTWRVSYEGTVDKTLENASSFVAKKGKYVITYSKTEGEDSVAVATHTVFADTSEISPLSANSVYQEKDPVRPFKYPETVENSAGNGLFETGAVRIKGETPADQTVSFMCDTGVLNELSEIAFYFYNASSSSVTFRYNADANTAVLPAGQWTRVAVDGGTFDWYARIHPNIGTGKIVDNVWNLRFVFNVAQVNKYDISVAVKMDKGAEKEALIPMKETSKFASKGETVTVPEIEGATWKISRDGTELPSLANAKTFKAEEFGIYTIKFERMQNGKLAKGTYTVYVENPANLLPSDASAFVPSGQPGYGMPKVEVSSDVKFLGQNAIKLSGAFGPDMGVVWKTGIYNDIDKLTFYIYNKSASAVIGRFNADGTGGMITIGANQWGRHYSDGKELNWYLENHKEHCTAYKVNGEWHLRIRANVSNVSSFELYLFAVLEKGDPNPPTIDFDTPFAFAEKNSDVAIPEIAGATWIVKKNGVEIPSLANAKSFTVDGYGIFEVEYTKVQGNETATGVYTVYADDPANLLPPDLTKVERCEPPFTYPTPAIDSEHKLYGQNTLKLSGTGIGPDTAIILHTGIYNNIEKLALYFRNNAAETITVRLNGDSKMLMVPTGRWERFSQENSTWNWFNQNHGLTGERNATAFQAADGEWCLRIRLKNSSGIFDADVAVYFEKGEAYAPKLVLDKTEDFAEKGSTVTLPVIEGASWTVSLNGTEIPALANAKSFTADSYGVYTVNYSKTIAGLTGTAAYNVYVENSADRVPPVAANGVTLPGGFAMPSVSVNETVKLFGQNTLRLSGTGLGPDIGIVYHTGIYNNLNNLSFYYYNAGSETVKIRLNADSEFVYVPSGGWKVFSQIKKTWDWYNVNHGIIGERSATAFQAADGEWCFRILVNGTGNYDVSLGFYFEKGEAYAPKLVLDKTEDFAEKGSTVTVPELAGASWTVSLNGTEIPALANAKTFKADSYGVYTVNYSKSVGGLTGTAVYQVYVENPANLIPAGANQTEALPAPFSKPTAEADTTNKIYGQNTLRLHGTGLGYDTGILWKTGIYNDLNNLTFYVRNNSSADVIIRFNADGHNGRTIVPAGGWIVFSQSAHLWNWYNQNHGLIGEKNATAFQAADGEWCLRICLHGNNEFDVSIGAAFEKGAAYAPKLTLDKTEDFAEKGSTVTVPELSGANWTVSLNGTEIPELANAKTFKADVSGIYTVTYSKTVAGLTGTATYTVYCESLDNLIPPAAENGVTAPGGFGMPSVSVNETVKLLGTNTLRLSGTGLGPDIGIVYHTGIYSELNNLRFYYYNAGSETVTIRFNGDADSLSIPSGAFKSFTQPGQSWNWYNVNHGLAGEKNATAFQAADGEWCFRIYVKGSGNYDVSIGMAFEKGAAYTPKLLLDRTQELVEKGSTVTVPDIDGAVWTVNLNGTDLPELANAKSFPADTVGRYTVSYSKTVGGLTGKAIYTAYSVISSEIVDADPANVTELGAPFTTPQTSRDTEHKALGGDTLRIFGTGLGYDTGIYWNTKLRGELTNLVFFVRNNTEADIAIRFNGDGHDGKVIIPANSWTGFTQVASTWNWYNTNHGIIGGLSATAFVSEQGEWNFRIWLNGNNNFDVSIGAFFSQG